MQTNLPRHIRFQSRPRASSKYSPSRSLKFSCLRSLPVPSLEPVSKNLHQNHSKPIGIGSFVSDSECRHWHVCTYIQTERSKHSAPAPVNLQIASLLLRQLPLIPGHTCADLQLLLASSHNSSGTHTLFPIHVHARQYGHNCTDQNLLSPCMPTGQIHDSPLPCYLHSP